MFVGFADMGSEVAIDHSGGLRGLSMRRSWILIAAVFCIAAMLIPVQAADGKWMMRGRGLYISPNASADSDLEGVDVDGQLTFELDFTRFIGKHIALELVLATASHNVTIEDQSLGSVSLLPPSLTAQWHFIPDGKLDPYVGVGVNATFFYESTGGLDPLDFDTSFGYVLNAGLDWKVGSTVYLNFDLKQIGMESDVKFEGDEVGTVTIDPLTVGVGLGFRF
jgi:outer membrane protein